MSIYDECFTKAIAEEIDRQFGNMKFTRKWTAEDVQNALEEMEMHITQKERDVLTALPPERVAPRVFWFVYAVESESLWRGPLLTASIFGVRS